MTMKRKTCEEEQKKGGFSLFIEIKLSGTLQGK